MDMPSATLNGAEAFGRMLRDCRRTRRLSQLDLALNAEVSQRHLSFLESGRARPSRDMVLLLAQALDLPLDTRNRLLNAAGFAPLYPRRALDAAAMTPCVWRWNACWPRTNLSPRWWWIAPGTW